MLGFLFRSRREPLWKDALAGAAAGAIGAFVMSPAAKQFSKLLPEPRKKGPENQEPSTEKLARVALGQVGISLSDEKKAMAGQVVHYGYGVFLGALYGAVWPRVSWVGKLFGLGYGLSLFVASDEVMVTALKLAPPPKQLPWTTHVGGLVAHLTYGLTADAGFRLLRRAIV